ncbi:MAG: cupin domain-containing protein [Planctomycetes bacterium]|nr:cupin domain-containing protein [Planctomycetota bacterium]
MIKRSKDMRRTSQDNLRGGNGTVHMTHFLDPEEACEKGRMFAIATLPPGASIGKHTHEGEYEIYQMLKGTATITDNGVEDTLAAGDCMVCYNGDNHSIENRTNEDIQVLFIVLFDKK